MATTSVHTADTQLLLPVSCLLQLNRDPQTSKGTRFPQELCRRVLLAYFNELARL